MEPICDVSAVSDLSCNFSSVAEAPKSANNQGALGFGNPPVSYSTYSCYQAAPAVLRASDFKEGRFGIVKRID
jgi:hypothetical protein